MNQAQKETSITAFTKALASSASRVLSQALGSEWDVTANSSQRQQSSDIVTLMVEIAGSVEGELAMRLARPDAAQLAGLFMGASESESEWSSQTQEAVEELFRQVLGELATQLKPRFGAITLRLSGDAMHSTVAMEALLTARSGPRLIPMTLLVSDRLVAALDEVTAAVTPPVKATDDRSPVERNLDLLMDVELGATLRFGRKVMPLRTILELASGSVIELDRQVQEPVDLLLDGKLLARGEVVIIDGNYGLRVTEIAANNQQPMWQ